MTSTQHYYVQETFNFLRARPFESCYFSQWIGDLPRQKREKLAWQTKRNGNIISNHLIIPNVCQQPHSVLQKGSKMVNLSRVIYDKKKSDFDF